MAKYRISNSIREKTKEYSVSFDNAEEYEFVEFCRLGGQALVYLNGELIGDNIRWHGRQCRTSICPYRFYCKFKKGENRLKVVFTYADTDLPLISGYVKLGKRKNHTWRIKLHYGKARVFVRSGTPDKLKLTFR